MVRSERLFTDREYALNERFGLRIAALILVQRGEVVERCADIEVIGSEFFLGQCQGAFRDLCRF